MESQMIKSIFCYRLELIKLTSIYTDDVDAGQKQKGMAKLFFGYTMMRRVTMLKKKKSVYFSLYHCLAWE